MTVFFVVLCTLYPVHVSAHEFSGEVGLEFRTFSSLPRDPRQHNSNFSGYVQPEYYHSWDAGKESFTVEPFFRLDQLDKERTHFDLRQAYWQRIENGWELRVGLNKVFWGVAETNHLIDIINQTDAVENVDGEDKLGQPMVNFTLKQSWGTVNLFVLPGFRERTFAGDRGRLRAIPFIDEDRTIYEHPDKYRHIDVAARWSHYIGIFDLGLAHFSGTGREPTLLLASDGSGNPFFVPFYEIIDQTSIDIQATTGGYLWKFEGFKRSGQGQRFFAGVGGVEYTFVGISGTPYDVGVLAEYHRDDRNSDATTPFQNDLFSGLRFVMNDAQSTEALAGVSQDVKDDSGAFFIEASRRLGEGWKINLESRLFYTEKRADPLFSVRKDDYLQLNLIWFY